MTSRTAMTSLGDNMTLLMVAVDHVNDSRSSGGGEDVMMGEASYHIYFTWIYRIIYAVGLAGNAFALLVWARSRLKSSPVTYFQAICVADSLVLVMHPLETVHAVHVQGVCQLVHVLFLAVQVFAILLVLGLSIERYIELCRPLLAEILISHKRTVRCILLLALGSLLVSLCEAYTWVLDPNTALCRLRQTWGRRLIWTYAVLVLTVLFVGPLAAVVVLNTLVARRIKHRRRNSLAFSSAMVPDKHNFNVPVTLVCLYLAVCELVYAAVHISHYFQHKPDPEQFTNGLHHEGSNKSDMPLTGRWRSYDKQSLALMVVDVIALTSYAVDLTIFTLCSRTFRHNVRDLFRRYRSRRSILRGYQLPAGNELR